MLFFQKDAMIAQKTKFLILFIPQINIKSIEALLVDMDLILKKIIIIIKKKQFLEDF
jgi:hypothetical protein